MTFGGGGFWKPGNPLNPPLVGTLFKKALDEIHGQTLQILGFF